MIRQHTLQLVDDRIVLVFKTDKTEHTLAVDFVNGPLGYRLKQNITKSEPLLKAVGLKKGVLSLTVWDLTAGLGRDGFLLAHAGCNLTLVERSPVISALLRDGLRRALLNADLAATVKRIQLITADSFCCLTKMSSESNGLPDVIYLDPMFSKDAFSKSALNKIEMRLMRDVVGDDSDADRLFGLAITKAQKRVVVKRARHAPPLTNKTPDLTVNGRSHRYDVYLTFV